MQRILVVAALTLAGLAAARADEPVSPLSCIGHGAQLARTLSATYTFQLLDDRGRSSATALYNATPPESEEEFAHAWVADVPDNGGIILFGRASLGCTAMKIALEHWERVKNVVLGNPI